MKKFLGEFKDFINRGNVMDLAVAVIIGGAFTAIVTALTTNIINPFISFIAGGTPGELSGLVVPGTEIDFGAFISAVINFLIVAFIGLGALQPKTRPHLQKRRCGRVRFASVLNLARLTSAPCALAAFVLPRFTGRAFR